MRRRSAGASDGIADAAAFDRDTRTGAVEQARCADTVVVDQAAEAHLAPDQFAGLVARKFQEAAQVEQLVDRQGAATGTARTAHPGCVPEAVVGFGDAVARQLHGHGARRRFARDGRFGQAVEVGGGHGAEIGCDEQVARAQFADGLADIRVLQNSRDLVGHAEQPLDLGPLQRRRADVDGDDRVGPMRRATSTGRLRLRPPSTSRRSNGSVRCSRVRRRSTASIETPATTPWETPGCRPAGRCRARGS